MARNRSFSRDNRSRRGYSRRITGNPMVGAANSRAASRERPLKNQGMVAVKEKSEQNDKDVKSEGTSSTA
jgi:hypothetical protein